MVLIDEEHLVISAYFEHFAALRIDDGAELLLEVYPDRLLKRVQAAAADFGLLQTEVRPYQDAGFRPEELYFAGNLLRLSSITEESAVNLMLPRSADAFVNQTRHVEKHGKSKNMACNEAWSTHEVPLVRVANRSL